MSSPTDKAFTLIELMLVIAIIAVIFTLVLPVYSNYSIRSKLSEVLGSADSTKTAIASVCLADRQTSDFNTLWVGHRVAAESTDKRFLRDIEVSGSCATPAVTITTRKTRQLPDPMLILTAALSEEGGEYRWHCKSPNTPDWLLPKNCRG